MPEQVEFGSEERKVCGCYFLFLSRRGGIHGESRGQACSAGRKGFFKYKKTEEHIK